MAARLIITGFMGSGKTSVARELAASLGWRFCDADAEAEKRMGMSIAEAFDRLGEAGFREVEVETVGSLLDETAGSVDNTVVALGGGAVTSKAVRERLAAEPLVLYLDVDVDTAFARAADGTRPLARDREQFGRLYEQRQGLYREVATRVVDSRGMDIGELVQRISKIIEEGGA